MKGIVKSFVSEKRYGFIEGEDKESYFVHISDTNVKNLTRGQEVEFDPIPTPKGLSAKKVKARKEPEKIYLNPKEFIITKSSTIKGYQIVHVVIEQVRAESNDPNKAKNLLKNIAIRKGANAIINLTLKKYSEYAGCSNYQYTMHRFYGKCVVIKKVDYSNDPKKIEESKKEMEQYEVLNTSKYEHHTMLVKPPRYILYPKIYLGILKSIINISFLSFGIFIGFIKKQFS